MNGRRLYTTGVLLFFIVIVETSIASGGSQGSECRPACRKGFVCIDGKCVSECNPPCTAGYVCRDSDCVPAGRGVRSGPDAPLPRTKDAFDQRGETPDVHLEDPGRFEGATGGEHERLFVVVEADDSKCLAGLSKSVFSAARGFDRVTQVKLSEKQVSDDGALLSFSRQHDGSTLLVARVRTPSAISPTLETQHDRPKPTGRKEEKKEKKAPSDEFKWIEDKPEAEKVPSAAPDRSASPPAPGTAGSRASTGPIRYTLEVVVVRRTVVRRNGEAEMQTLASVADRLIGQAMQEAGGWPRPRPLQPSGISTTTRESTRPAAAAAEPSLQFQARPRFEKVKVKSRNPWFLIGGGSALVVSYLATVIVAATYGRYDNPNARRAAYIPLAGPILARNYVCDHDLEGGIDATGIVGGVIQIVSLAVAVGGGIYFAIGSTETVRRPVDSGSDSPDDRGPSFYLAPAGDGVQMGVRW